MANIQKEGVVISYYFEKLMVSYCSCTLAGIKVGSMLSCLKSQFKDLESCLTYYQKVLDEHGLKIELLATKDTIWIVYIYNPYILSALMEDDKIQKFLSSFGYSSGTLEEKLCFLKERLKKAEFPHEIGVFLGYPLDDIQSFMKNEGRDYKLNGDWKVYHDPVKKYALFQLYKDCRIAWMKAFEKEKNIIQILRN